MPQQPSKQPDFIPAAAPDFIPAGPEYIPAPQAPPAQNKEPGFLESLLPRALSHPSEAAQDEQAHPVRSVIEGLPGVAPLENAFSGVTRSAGEIGRAFSDLHSGNSAGATVHAIGAVPIAGPALVKAGQQAPASTGNYGKDLINDATDPNVMAPLAEASAELAPVVLGGVDAAAPGRSLFGQIPRSSRAIAKFEALKTDLAHVPVPLTNSAPALQKLAEIDATGPPMPVTALKLLNRSQAVFPPDYPEARMFQENLSNPSILEKQSLGGTMKGGIKQLKGGLYEDIYNAASGVGRGEDYAQAMKEFRQAAQLKNIATKAAKYGGTAALGAAGAGALKKVFSK